VNVDGVDVAIHERIEINKPFCELRRFKRFSDDTETLGKLKGQPAVLVVAPLSGHYATLLRDTVKTMLKDHKVYITDWKNARLVPLEHGEFHLDDYVNYVQEFIRHLQAQYGNCHVMSVCQPTVPVMAAVSLMASRGETTPLSMTMMGGPLDARKSPTAVNDLATQRSIEWFENNVIFRVPSSFPGAGRRVYPGFLQHTGFVAMNPDKHLTSHYDYFKDLVKGDHESSEAHRKFYDEYNAVLDMDADYYLETIQTVFREFKLVNGTWDVKNPQGVPERVRPQDITTTALLSVEGEFDDISGAGQSEAAHSMCTGIPDNMCLHYEAKGAGHYGIFSGRRWRENVYPVVKQFILDHSLTTAAKATPVAAAPKAAAATKAKVAPSAKVLSVTSGQSVAAQPEATPAVKVAKPSRQKALAAPVASPKAKAVATAAVVVPAKPQSVKSAPSAKAKAASQAQPAVKVSPTPVAAAAPATTVAQAQPTPAAVAAVATPDAPAVAAAVSAEASATKS
jgi:poly(3-hydroxybutyrate) depolymerase